MHVIRLLQMQDMLDNLERALTFVSPVKGGLGMSALDRTLRCDNRGELFFKELAALEAEEKAKAGRVGSKICSLQPVGEVGLMSKSARILQGMHGWYQCCYGLCFLCKSSGRDMQYLHTSPTYNVVVQQQW